MPVGSFYLAVGTRSYPFPSQLALHLADPERVHAASLVGRGALNYRYWDHPERLLGRDAVVVLEDYLDNAARLADVARCFESVEPAEDVSVSVGRIPLLPDRRVHFLFCRAHGYRGPLAAIGKD